MLYERHALYCCVEGTELAQPVSFVRAVCCKRQSLLAPSKVQQGLTALIRLQEDCVIKCKGKKVCLRQSLCHVSMKGERSVHHQQTSSQAQGWTSIPGDALVTGIIAVGACAMDWVRPKNEGSLVVLR